MRAEVEPVRSSLCARKTTLRRRTCGSVSGGHRIDDRSAAGLYSDYVVPIDLNWSDLPLDTRQEPAHTLVE
jgi:hypothetical protein